VHNHRRVSTTERQRAGAEGGTDRGAKRGGFGEAGNGLGVVKREAALSRLVQHAALDEPRRASCRRRRLAERVAMVAIETEAERWRSRGSGGGGRVISLARCSRGSAIVVGTKMAKAEGGDLDEREPDPLVARAASRFAATDAAAEHLTRTFAKWASQGKRQCETRTP